MSDIHGSLRPLRDVYVGQNHPVLSTNLAEDELHVTFMVIQANLEMSGIEPETFHMRSERSTTELHPLQ